MLNKSKILIIVAICINNCVDTSGIHAMSSSPCFRQNLREESKLERFGALSSGFLRAAQAAYLSIPRRTKSTCTMSNMWTVLLCVFECLFSHCLFRIALFMSLFYLSVYCVCVLLPCFCVETESGRDEMSHLLLPSCPPFHTCACLLLPILLSINPHPIILDSLFHPFSSNTPNVYALCCFDQRSCNTHGTESHILKLRFLLAYSVINIFSLNTQIAAASILFTIILLRSHHSHLSRNTN